MRLVAVHSWHVWMCARFGGRPPEHVLVGGAVALKDLPDAQEQVQHQPQRFAAALLLPKHRQSTLAGTNLM